MPPFVAMGSGGCVNGCGVEVTVGCCCASGMAGLLDVTGTCGCAVTMTGCGVCPGGMATGGLLPLPVVVGRGGCASGCGVEVTLGCCCASGMDGLLVVTGTCG